MSAQKKNDLSSKDLKALKLEEIKLLEEEIRRRESLPHLYGWKWYSWARKFFESREKEILLIAGNQLSKSSTQIRKCIHWATDKSIWPELWPHMTPNQFWYLYPNRDTSSIEFNTKWRQFLPRIKEDPVYGYNIEFDKKIIKAVHFHSGVSIYFKVYNQDTSDLQSGTCYYIACDEELPLEKLGEIQARLNATDGYFSKVFTATIGQDYWRRAMEPRFPEEEVHREALKMQISLYDCLLYEDGTRSHWTEERIERIKRKCSTDQEIQVRVYGKFAKLGGRRFESYDDVANRTDRHGLPRDWLIYTGVDIGSGGEVGHPAAIVFVAVDPIYRKGRVFMAWRGDGLKTTAGDIYVKYVEMRGSLKPVLQCYDWSSAEFRQIAERAGDSFEPAYKKKKDGIGLVNTLFKSKMLAIQRGDPELDKLSSELMDVSTDALLGDDLADALRFSCSKVPWDFSGLEGLPVEPVTLKKELTEEERRRGIYDEEQDISLEQEFDEWNEMYNV